VSSIIYSESIVDKVKNATSLVSLIGERTEVKVSGRKHVCCCPFHSEKTPSFHINEEEGLYYCFGCGKKGNTFTFVMETRGLTFPEAVRFLANKAGISLPASSPSETKNLQKRNHLKKILSEAQNFYEDSFWNSPSISKPFLEKRLISTEVAKRFHIGLAVKKSGGLVDAMYKILSTSHGLSKKETEEGLLEVGLLRQREGGRLSDLFWDRIMFPITRSDHSVQAFGGRALTDHPDNPKYINSPETSIFEKRRSFYGMGPGFLACQKQKEVFIVEGYIDVIAFSQLGIENTLAVCGTALTDDHAKILSRIVKRAYLVFDGDKAGRMALSRSFQAFINSGIEVIPIFLPEGEDPDTLRINRDEKEVRNILDQGKGDLLKLYLQLLAAEVRGLERGQIVDLSSIQATEAGEVAERICKIFSGVNNPVEREILLKNTCGYLGVGYDTLNSMIAPSVTHVPKIVRRQNQENDRAIRNEPQFGSASDKSLSVLKRQLMVASIVDPGVLRLDLLLETLQEAFVGDEKLTYFLSRLTSAFRTQDITLAQALDEKELREEVIAKLHGILLECGLEGEGLLEEAFHQLDTGGAEYKKLMGSLTQAIERLRLRHDINAIKTAEGKGQGVKDQILMAQEKLLKKRELSAK
jgi:DNA primase